MDKMTYLIYLQKIREKIPENQLINFNLHLASNEKNPTVALVFSLLFGSLGVDRFYVGPIGLGFLKLFTLGACGIWTIIDWFLIMGAAREKNIELAYEIQNSFYKTAPSLQDTPSNIALNETAIKQDEPTQNMAASTTPMPQKQYSTFNTNAVKIIVFTLIGGFFIGCFYLGNDDNKNTSRNGKGYTLNSAEENFVNNMLRKEMGLLLTGKNSLIKDDLILASSSAIQVDYDENAAAADKKYYHKKIVLTGYIASINSGFGNTPYITLISSNSFLQPQAHFQNSDDPKISDLKKFSAISIICTSEGTALGAPLFDECIFPDNYAENKTNELKKEILAYLSGETPSDDFIANKYPLFVISMITAARGLPNSSSCFSSGDKCNEEVENLFNHDHKLITQKMNAVANELKADGVSIPDNLMDNF